VQIIPVIDLKDGQVVHAKHGLRALYQPIQSALSNSSQVHDIVAGLLKLYPFKTIYIADIDAIQCTGTHAGVINKLCQQYPKISWWVDSGKLTSITVPNYLNVIGTESVLSMQYFQKLHRECDGKYILSLDYKDGEPLGLQIPHTSPHYWPKQVICMTLNAVGSNRGPELRQIQSLQALSVQTSIYAAGGVRDAADLRMLRDCDVAGALIATALHNGKISAEEIYEISQ